MSDARAIMVTRDAQVRPLVVPPLLGLVGVLAVLTGCGEAAPVMEAVAGEGGVALFFEAPPPATARLVARDPGEVETRSLDLPTGTTAVDPHGLAGTSYALQRGGSTVSEAVAQPLPAAVTGEPWPGLLLAGEDLALTVSVDALPGELVHGELVVRRLDPLTGAVAYLDPPCLDEPAIDEDCWLDAPASSAAVEGVGAGGASPPLTVELPPLTISVEAPARLLFGGFLWMGNDLDGGVLGGAETEAIALPWALRWGDPHGHSNLSYDGCEEPDDRCRDSAGMPGETYFSNAVAAGLDFAAMTEHAEYDQLVIDDGSPIDLWTQQLVTVEAAERDLAPDFVALLGIEWTSYAPAPDVPEGGDPADYADDWVAGHKTVLFRDIDVCRHYHIASVQGADVFEKGPSGQIYSQVEPRYTASTVEELYDRLDAAEEACGHRDHLMFFHHTATYRPYPVNWSLEINVPRADTEMLVEIASGHGSAECRDVTAEGCDFWINDLADNVHLGFGSIQEALTAGYRLGFLGGGDRHDGRPGAVDSDPPYVGFFEDTDGDGEPDTPNQMWGAGALTGVYASGELTRDALWDGLLARRTLATSGPRGSFSMAARGADDAIYVPGDVVPASAFPLDLVARIEPEDGDIEVELVEVVDPVDGGVVASAADSGLAATLAATTAPALYVRARLRGRGGAEHRVWLSPLFIETDGGQAP